MIMQILFWKMGACEELVILTLLLKILVCTFLPSSASPTQPIVFNLIKPNPTKRQSRESAAAHGPSMKANVLRFTSPND